MVIEDNKTEELLETSNGDEDDADAMVPKADLDNLTKQYKGLQRKLNKAIKQADSTITSEEVSAKVDLMGQSLNALLQSINESGMASEQVSAVISEIRSQGDSAVEQLKLESKFQREIVGIEAESDFDFEDDEVATVLWESGKHEEAAKHFESFAKSDNTDEIAKAAKVEAERIVRDAGGNVDTEGSTTRSATGTNTTAGIKAAALKAQEAGDTKTMIDLLAKAASLKK